MRVLFITDLAFQEAGNQVLYETVKGFIRAGHEVHMLVPQTVCNKMLNIEYLHLHPFRPSLSGWHSIIPLMNSGDKHISSQEMNSISEEVYQTLYTNGASRSFIERNTYNSWVHLGIIISFSIGAFSTGFNTIRKHNIDLLYGYEVTGIPITSILSRLMSVPCAMRYQGTFAYPYLDSLHNMLKVGSFIFPMLFPSDLIFMENDGTHGDQVLKRFHVTENKIHFVLGGVNRNNLLRPVDRSMIKSRLGFAPDDLVLLSVNKFKYWKRIDRIIRSFAQVAPNVPNAYLVVIGHGQEESYLKELARRLGVIEHVRFIGPIPHQSIGDYYAITDVFMITNDVSNLGLSLLEAMTCGCCILSLDDGSLTGLISNGQNGILVNADPQDHALTEALQILLENRELRQRLGEHASITATCYLKDWQDRADTEVVLLEELVVGRG